MYEQALTETIRLLHARREEIDSVMGGIQGGRMQNVSISRSAGLDNRIRETLEELYFAKAGVEVAIERLGRFASLRR